MDVFIETKRLIITTPELSDFENLYALQSDAEVMQHIGNGVRTREEVILGLEKAIAHQIKHGFSLGNVFEKETEQFIGRAGLIYLGYDDTQPEIEIAYALIKSAWNKGYATELARALIKWGFQHLPITKLIAVTKPNNERSRRVLEKAHMLYVGQSLYSNIEVAKFEILKK